MHPRQIVFLVAIAVVSTGCSGAPSPAFVGALPAGRSAPAPSPSAAATPSPGDVIRDLEGDAVKTDDAEAPGYLDMLGAGVELRDGAFVFTQRLASGVPGAPDLSDGVVALGWSFCIDIDPGQSPRGYPTQSMRMPCEFIVQSRWDGKALTGMLFDRRPLDHGNQATTATLAPLADGSMVSATVPLRLLGEPSTFRWSAFTEELGSLGTDVFHHVDAVPDADTGRPATWPRLATWPWE
jgi:hypothetical protein